MANAGRCAIVFILIILANMYLPRVMEIGPAAQTMFNLIGVFALWGFYSSVRGGLQDLRKKKKLN